MEDLNMLVEIPKGSFNKYEFGKEKKWILDRVLSSSMSYPGDYGFIPETLGGDGEELDVICLMSYKTFPGCYVPIKIIGGLEMIDNGEKDDKIIAVNKVDPEFNNINDLNDLSTETVNKIAFFFEKYKTLERKKVEIKKIFGKILAEEMVKKCKDKYSKIK